MRKFAAFGLLWTMTIGQLHGDMNYCGDKFRPCNDAGIAYEQSIDQVRLATVIVVGVLLTAGIAAALVNTRCKCSH